MILDFCEFGIQFDISLPLFNFKKLKNYEKIKFPTYDVRVSYTNIHGQLYN